MNEFEACLEKRKIVKIKPTTEMIKKEVKNARYDLTQSEGSLSRKDYKWASVQAYYSMFHSAKALILHKGYREKSHYCLLVALRELYVKTGELDKEFADNYEMCMDIRHEADYGLTYSDESAKLSVKAAKQLLETAKNILGIKS